MSLIRQSRSWFVKALEVDANDEVAVEFIRQVSQVGEDDDV
jgi:hypothetical protein